MVTWIKQLFQNNNEGKLDVLSIEFWNGNRLEVKEESMHKNKGSAMKCCFNQVTRTKYANHFEH
jgi:hypothetical protein